MSSQEYYEYSASKTTARKVSNNKLVHAGDVYKKDGPFYCPDTFEELIVRKCFEKKDHFAYKAKQSPVGSKESDLHKSCKNELLAELQKAYPNGGWELERETFKANKEKGYKKVRPDISGRIGNKKDKGVIIEVQASVLSIKKILHRTEQYTKRGAYILWVVPLEHDLGNDNFRPRLFERFLHTMYYGRIYYWYKGNGGKLIPVHFGTAKRYIEDTHWFEEDGTERNEGGYYKAFLRVKKPKYGQVVDITQDFKFDNRTKFELENDKLSVPKCKIFIDKRPIWWKNKKSR